jgi:hypothetical protein
MTRLLGGEEMGEGSEGFSRVLRRLGAMETGSGLTIKYALRTGSGGGQFRSDFPFHNRLNELDAVVAERGLVVKYEVGGW